MQWIHRYLTTHISDLIPGEFVSQERAQNVVSTVDDVHQFRQRLDGSRDTRRVLRPRSTRRRYWSVHKKSMLCMFTRRKGCYERLLLWEMLCDRRRQKTKAMERSPDVKQWFSKGLVFTGSRECDAPAHVAAVAVSNHPASDLARSSGRGV